MTYDLKVFLKNFINSIKKHVLGDMRLFYGTICLLFTYLLFLQPHFLFSGDVWAEAFPEYVNDALNSNWAEVFASGWAGYLTIIPSFLSKAYVALGLPLGFIDFYLRGITIIFAVVCIAFISHPINRGIIKNDTIRVMVAFIMFLSMRHISALAFINVWYLGFIVIIMISLARTNMGRISEIFYTIFAMLVALSKPSLVLLPFVIYYAIRTKSYKSSVLLSIAIIAQTFLTIFAKNGYGNKNINTHFYTILRDVFLGIGTFILKLLHVIPLSALMIGLASVATLGVSIFLWKKRGFWETAVIGIGLCASVYLYVFAPDNNFNNLWVNYTDLYHNMYKIQREIIINFLILLIFGIFMSSMLSIISLSKSRINTLLSILITLVLIYVNPLSKIDMSIPGVQSDISAYRNSLNHKESICIPVPPTQMWDFRAMWFFQYKGGCYTKQTSRTIKFSSFTQDISTDGMHFSIPSTPKDDLKTVVILIKNNSSNSPNGKLILSDNISGHTFTASIPQNSETYHFINFNVAGLGPRDFGYDFKVKSSHVMEQCYYGNFDESSEPVVYNYFMGYPNIQ